jgi:two-component system sensor histidine kinase VicK
MEIHDGNLISSLEKLTQFEIENKALREDNTRLRSVQTINQDFENRLLFEHAYQESQHRFRTIFEQSTFGNKIISSDLAITEVNMALEEMLGYSKEELVGTKILDYSHPDYKNSWYKLQESLWKKQLPSFHIETCLVRKDGSTLSCSVTSILFKDKGRTLGYTILEDITERKSAEGKLQKLYDSQEIILHTVAHDLKSPIHTIKSLSSFLKRNVERLQEASAEKKEQSLTFINMIADTCDRADTIIKDLLLIGEIELGKLNLKKERIEMKSFIDSQINSFQLRAKEKGIELNVLFPPEEVYAQINVEKFTRVVENLLSNAIKFTKIGGHVTISLNRKAQKVQLQVSDDGIGIPEGLQSSVFNKFTKANRQGTQGEATTGLGLFIVKKIVDLHQGKIWLESKENQGTDFYIELS